MCVVSGSALPSEGSRITHSARLIPATPAGTGAPPSAHTRRFTTYRGSPASGRPGNSSICAPACPRACEPACLRARVPACLRVRVPACPRARVPACPRARVPACPRSRAPARTDIPRGPGNDEAPRVTCARGFITFQPTPPAGTRGTTGESASRPARSTR
ncbi:hypothetical protein FL583_28600 [Cryptosporangium phraense]|uniref:Uncharacterized protein n=1 Tax=Cryptosporangium phraense TaxID=2593070 RepID=A0A545AK18_9ACTN|nr:hypothetical protein FL583_28600 [Cryptosporangium phraense]